MTAISSSTASRPRRPIKAELAVAGRGAARARRRARARHAARRRRPRLASLRRRQAPRLRRGRHRVDPRRPAGDGDRRPRCAPRSRDLNADPRRAPATSCSCRCPPGIDENAMLELIDPDKDADGLHPTNLGRLVLGVDGELHSPLPCTPAGIVELLRRYDVPIARQARRRHRPRPHRRPPARAALHPQGRRRDGDPHALAHASTSRPRCAAPTSSSRRSACRTS